MIEDMMPTPCACCDGITDFRNLTDDPLDEYEFVCTVCADDREQMKEDYDQEMEDEQKYINEG